MPFIYDRDSEEVLQDAISEEVEYPSRNVLIHLSRGNHDKRRAIIELADRLVNTHQESMAYYRDTLRYQRGITIPRGQPTWEIDADRALCDAKDIWRRSIDAMHVWDRISHAVRHGKLVGVNKIICFGLKGSRSWHQADPLTEDQERKGHGNPDLVRHVAALWIAEAIASCTRERVRVYSEGSSYLDRDVDALTAHGITPLSGERGQHESFLKIDAHMLVFMFSGIASKAIQVVCATNRPACIIAQIMRLNGAEEGLRRAFDHLDAEYREHADWLPFYLFAFHSGVRGPQSMEEFRREGQRPLQGATVWFRRARFNP